MNNYQKNYFNELFKEFLGNPTEEKATHLIEKLSAFKTQMKK